MVEEEGCYPCGPHMLLPHTTCIWEHMPVSHHTMVVCECVSVLKKCASHSVVVVCIRDVYIHGGKASLN